MAELKYSTPAWVNLELNDCGYSVNIDLLCGLIRIAPGLVLTLP